MRKAKIYNASSCLTRIIVFCIVVILIMVGIFIFAVRAQDAEDPEPTNPPITYAAQIAWGPVAQITEASWVDIPITAQMIVDGVPANSHKYWTIGLGDKRFEAVALESTTSAPKKVQFTINISSIPTTNHWWGDICRIRIYAKVTIDGNILEGLKSDASFWVGVINLKAPLKPLSNG